TPAGGYGMNTGVGDALALSWVLAAIIKGWGTSKLLAAYETERRPVAIQNREASGAHVLVRLKIAMAMRDAMYADSPRGEQIRKKIGDRILELTNLENEAIGIEAGYRYHDSPVICYDGEDAPPSFEPDKLKPSTYPGLRIPAIWLKDGRAIHDLLSNGFTLIRFDDTDVTTFEKAAMDCGMPLSVLDIRDNNAAKIYEKKLILVRSDQHVCWRGDAMPSDAKIIIDKVRGA
ncbi:MAG: FAD-monooxygenase, partial [Gammaproteobacteria bacterium]|nr:FAD-monooxygenase [Gammaproteobacteria bacterium]